MHNWSEAILWEYTFRAYYTITHLHQRSLKMIDSKTAPKTVITTVGSKLIYLSNKPFDVQNLAIAYTRSRPNNSLGLCPHPFDYGSCYACSNYKCMNNKAFLCWKIKRRSTFLLRVMRWFARGHSCIKEKFLISFKLTSWEQMNHSVEKIEHKNLLNCLFLRFDLSGEKICYSGSNNYLIPCWICRFAHLQRMELCIILIIGTF